MKTREQQINDLRLEYEMRMDTERRDHALSLQRAIEDLNAWLDTEMNPFARWPMTRQGEAIRAYIRQYKEKRDNE